MPAIVVPDNLKSAVTKACRYDPDLNPSYQQIASHYGTALVPARHLKPKDKAKAEVGVQIIERGILARLRHHTFFSLGEIMGEIMGSKSWGEIMGSASLKGHKQSIKPIIDQFLPEITLVDLMVL